MSNLDIIRAVNLAITAHAGQKDRAGKEYIYHPLFVAESLAKEGANEAAIIAALLHDVAEDTDITLNQIEYVFSDSKHKAEIMEALRLLKHEKNVPYMDYVQALKNNDIARKVKCADLQHNMMLNRLPHITDKDLERVMKYKRAYEILTEG